MHPRAWFATFDNDSVTDFQFEPESELGRSRLRYAARARIQDPERGPQWDYHGTEWTAVISVFLAQMAKDCGFVQEWEWGPSHIDFAWFSPGATSPTVLIEHENDSEGIDVRKNKRHSDGEVWKLSRELSRLPTVDFGVLITYPEGKEEQSAPGIARRARHVLRREGVGPERFLLALGKVGENDWEEIEWEGALWNGQDWESL